MSAEILVYGAAIVFVYMTFWYGVAILTRRSDIVDTAWGLGFVLLAWLGLVESVPAGLDDAGALPWRTILVTLLVTLWGLRLALYVYSRNRGTTEDFRYAAWRRDWGRWFPIRAFLQIFMLQGLFMVLVASPIATVMRSTPTAWSSDAGLALGWLDAVGAAIFLCGLTFEAVGDAQMRRFKADPRNKGRIMQTGLWAWTRHPNYFGESLLWWGLGVVALSEPMGWTGLIGPAVITFLLLKVSGVPMLEKKYAGRPDYEEYKQRTSIFIPLPPKRENV